MSDSILSFANSSSFRNTLIARNLAPYQVQGVYTPPAGNVTYEASPLSDSNVIDSPDFLISTNVRANLLYPLNEYGPEPGFVGKYTVPGQPYPVESNKGPYDYGEANIDLVNEFYIDLTYVNNKYGPSEGTYKDMYVVTDSLQNVSLFSPYSNTDGFPITFIPSFYSPFQILTSNNPFGSDGTLSQDSYLAKIGATYLKGYFNERIASEIEQLTVGSINLDTLSDPFSASLLATGQQPFFIKNWKITVPENPVLAAVSFANRLSGTYFPVSFIPGDYFNENNPEANVSGALNTANNLTGGALGGVLNKYRSPSELFLANTGNGQQSILFANLNYNLYRPLYQKNLIQGASQAINNLFNGDNGGGGYYVGNQNAEPSQITNPSNEVAVDRFGKQQATLVYGPDELGKIYEGNEGKLNFGLGARSHHDGDGIDGKFVWTSPKYRPNAGFKVGRGGEVFQLDNEFNIIEGQYSQDQSIDVDFKGGSILDNTQRIINSADNVQGAKKLKHVGNAINQVSKVFNDGYKELTKGSQVIAYYDSTTGSNTIGESGFEVGREYCRVFQKDTPYYTYADLQKTDGITTSGRRFHNSVFDNTYNLNIVPLRNPGSTNIVDNKVKKYMFSLENLAWRTSSEPGYRYDDLPICEKGPNGGRTMWFPPYNLTFNEDSKANWTPTSFIGRPEPIFTYKETTRTGSISWTIVVDHPSVMNTIVRQQLKSKSPQEVNSILDSFFAGCVKYDLYDLAIKFNTIPTSELYTYQQILNEPRKTQEEIETVIQGISVDYSLGGIDDAGGQGGGDGTLTTDITIEIEQGPSIEEEVQLRDLDAFQDYAFYFENDSPYYNQPIKNISDPAEWKVAGPWSRDYKVPCNYENCDYEAYYDFYLSLRNKKYVTNAPEVCWGRLSGKTEVFKKEGVQPFFENVVIDNFDVIKNELMPKIKELIVEKNAVVQIQLVGSASPIQVSLDYNRFLSDRRIDSVVKWMKKQNVGGEDFQKFFDEGKIIVNTESLGEEAIITPKSKDGTNFTIDCNQNILDGPVFSTAKKNDYGGEWYSVPAMACRKVRIKSIVATRKVKPQEDPVVDITFDPVEIPDSSGTTGSTTILIPPLKIIDQPDPIISVKENISKKILRHLFSECDYFDVLKETDPMVFDSLKDRIKYFSPTFHSITPEGLNARLTFLQQCMRPGQTIPVIGPDGKPKYNDAQNTAFGAPPILVLRVGDFFHTKIVPQSLGIQYEPLLFDINPEGIGIQPMLAKVTLGFEFIGGHGLAEPIKQLQNALSFNYYANTEIYDERSVATEDTKERDEQVVARIVKGAGSAPPPVTTQNVVNQIPQKGGGTIGTIQSTNYVNNNNVEEGDISYTSLITELSENTRNYFTTIFNQFRTITNVTNYGILSLVYTDRKFTDGKFSEYETPTGNIPLYGRSLTIESRIQSLIEQTILDVNNGNAPIIFEIEPFSAQLNATSAQIRELQTKLADEVAKMQNRLNEYIIEPVNTITTYQENYNYILRKMDLICSKVDGTKTENGKYKVYTLSGDNLTKITEEYTQTVGNKVTDFSLKFLKTNFYDQNIYENNNFDPILTIFVTPEQRRFYMTMSPVFLNDNLYNDFVNNLISGEKIKTNTKLVDSIKKYCDLFKKNFISEHDEEIKKFNDLQVSEDYQQYDKFEIVEFDSTLQYTTDNIGNTNQKKDRLKNLYSDVNLNKDEKTYNGKVKFS